MRSSPLRSSLVRPGARKHRATRDRTALLFVVLCACGSDDPIVGAGTPAPTNDGGFIDGGLRGALDAGLRDPRASTPPSATSQDGGADEASGTCVGLQCQQMACAGGGTTSISGTIYDPAGKNPLYNIAVYVPNEAVQELKSGATCDTCESLYTGKPIASALTDAAGKFTLDNAPVGSDIPLVVQVGKWRRQFKISTVKACQDNPQADKSLRLPRNRQEGDIPKIAVSTGGSDTLECLLRRIGVDASEFVPGNSADGRIQIFQGDSSKDNGAPVSTAPNTSPAAPRSSDALWSSAESLLKFDIVLLSCEGAETDRTNQQALHDYTDAGGRVFASHYHYAWFNTGPYSSENLATWKTGAQDLGNINAEIVTTLPSGQPFIKGQALQSWLTTTNALTNGKLPITDAKNNAVITAANTPSQTWITADQSAKVPDAVEYFSFNTPTAVTGADFVAGTCGRVVYSDLHVGAASGDNPSQPVPVSCKDADLSPQEKALEFMLFDLSSCITPDTAPPAPPVIIAL